MDRHHRFHQWNWWGYYAHYLAKQGIHILQISRSKSKLKNVAADLKQYGIETGYLVRDFSFIMDPAAISQFRAKLDMKLGELTSRGSVGIWINSIVLGLPTSSMPTLVHEIDEEEVRERMSINQHRRDHVHDQGCTAAHDVSEIGRHDFHQQCELFKSHGSFFWQCIVPPRPLDINWRTVRK